MAKQIKTIKCQQCGSTQNTSLKEDHYKCNNCGSEYFLDNDDININVTHKVEGHPVPKNIKNTVTAVVTISILLIGLFFFLMGKSSKRRSFSDSPYGSIMLDIPVEVKGKPYLLTLSNSISADDKGSFYTFTDFDTKKIEKTEKLQNVDEMKITIQDRIIRKFLNGDIYIIIDKQRIFKLDNDNMALRDVTISMFEGDSLYKSGIADIEPFINVHDGDCFKVMTNMGKEYYYYPRIKQSYTQKELSKEMETLRPDSKETVKYV